MDAGGFTDWILEMQRGMRTGAGADVPCGECVACCTSGQLVPVEAAERHLLPEGSVVEAGGGAVLRLTEDGGCALLIDGRCSVYELRPNACRTYDCRIFPAAGVSPEDDKPAIAARAAGWVFRLDTDEDRARFVATRTTATMIRVQQVAGRPTSATQVAAQAVLHHDELLR